MKDPAASDGHSAGRGKSGRGAGVPAATGASVSLHTSVDAKLHGARQNLCVERQVARSLTVHVDENRSFDVECAHRDVMRAHTAHGLELEVSAGLDLRKL